MSARVIRVVTAVICDGDGRLLLVRKHHTRVFMQPGGKPEPGEDARAALVRELSEELAVAVDPVRLVPLGTFRAPAANEPGHVVEAEMFRLDDAIDPIAAGEIAELWWCAPAAATERPVAPLTLMHVLAGAAPEPTTRGAVDGGEGDRE